MSDNPLDPSPAHAQAVEAQAKRLWEENGSPAGGPAAFTEQADALVRMQDAGTVGQLDNPMNHPAPVEEASIQANLGEFPGGSSVADQGEWRETPMTRDELRHGDPSGADRGDAP